MHVEVRPVHIDMHQHDHDYIDALRLPAPAQAPRLLTRHNDRQQGLHSQQRWGRRMHSRIIASVEIHRDQPTPVRAAGLASTHFILMGVLLVAPPCTCVWDRLVDKHLLGVCDILAPRRLDLASAELLSARLVVSPTSCTQSNCFICLRIIFICLRLRRSSTASSACASPRS